MTADTRSGPATRSSRDDLSRLAERCYPELRRLAERCLSRERRGHTLQPTALVHETFLRLCRQDAVRWEDRMQFLRLAAAMMRRILVNHERDRRRLKRGGRAQRLELADVPAGQGTAGIDLLVIEEALAELERIDPRKVEVVQLRFFAGLDLVETAAALDISVAQVKRDWALARAWLARALGAGDGS
ncbi:MAG: sigma-70 family RNA polymerase sigma factor [Planctomycetes bacterium]|nr:sigma-70 family RNA polymerase sigma factor [Planctomycetota bacterium]